MSRVRPHGGCLFYFHNEKLRIISQVLQSTYRALLLSMCSCVYVLHRACTLCVCRTYSDSKAGTEFRKLMHINPSMSGPVQICTNETGVVPYCIAFAGAEFIVLGKAVVQGKDSWHVAVEVRQLSTLRMVLPQRIETKTPAGLSDSQLGRVHEVAYNIPLET